ncbi:ASKHA domain-containing protein [Desulfobaculum bizertense]|uniref:Uncharacterized 2Fe-2 and 4Fe-4S clusters-containing protein, contains DUF4445 domain n=1 Tax=Desulfobaculum bizertense DSM 18034 TaxID=1121442 RepID=A0A1T4VPC1_9BACT|nr:ASKHA domain-containing protein [Desulfobaculum bizertense]UIJ38215.1 ASKHA domain-containing protein [Desulfobaculum bizertense]SKA66832.1 Uncharacterized 2Fe-2 and 4Fe-4S clusters-containing protein, contains DUF4445 domain [Desulfobaculum bizertense DSM 18034]
MNVSITICHKDKEELYTLPNGAPIKPLLQEHSLLDFPCGIGKCGKCLIYANSEPTAEERKKLDENALSSGLRLACHTKAFEGLKIAIPAKNALCVLSSFTRKGFEFKPAIRKEAFRISPASIERPQTDEDRVLEATSAKTSALPLAELRKLPHRLKHFENSSTEGYALIQGDTLLGISTEAAHHALIVDIGTTTVAVTLLNLETQRIAATKGAHNAQYPYGADVVSRIKSTIEQGTEPLEKAIINQLNTMLDALRAETGIADVSVISLAGNTTMMHLLCGIPPEFIGKAPFTPVSMRATQLPACELGLNTSAQAFLLPSISSYIGADIVASLLAVGAYQAKKPFLLIDFGTNAETVLFANNTFYCCSAAAGPCFEGATLSCGMAGQAGAIDTVELSAQNTVSYTSIENATPQGLCGSGVLDAIALMLETKALDETGRIEPEKDCPLRDCVNSEKGFMLTPKVSLTQADIREVQLAKAAVRAGIEVLIAEAGLDISDIETLYLAGGFGSALKANSAVRIGLIPEQLLEKICVMGNATSFGALRYITEENAAGHVQSIMDRAQYLELSARPEFTNAYIEQMVFPEK